MNNVGITGSKGVLGKILIKKLKERKMSYSCFKGNIYSKKDLKNWINDNHFWGIIHFAAITSTSEVEKDLKEAYKVNVEGTRNLISEIKNSKQNPWVFYASTSHIYKSKRAPINEKDKINPLSIYGKLKHLAEEIMIKNYENLCIGRIFSLYHETQKKPFLYPTIIERLKNEKLDKPFELSGANSIRDFLNANIVVDIIINLMIKKIKGIYNIGSGKGIMIKDFVQNLTNKKLNIKNIGSNNYLVADITKLKKILNKKF